MSFSIFKVVALASALAMPASAGLAQNQAPVPVAASYALPDFSVWNQGQKGLPYMRYEF